MHWLGLIKGGPGSGNFGHAGRPGQVGGSAPDDTPSGPAEIPSADKAESSRDLVTLDKYDDWKDSSGKRRVTLFHYSREDRTSTGLKRDFAGTAGAGEERRSFEYDKEGKLNTETVPVHAYMYGAKKESMVPGNVLHKIEAELNVLDVGSNKYREILSKARVEAERTGRPMLAMARAIAKEEGYDALASERDGIVQILRDVKPEELEVIGGAKKGLGYTPGPPAGSEFEKARKQRWEVKLKNMSKSDSDMELYSLNIVADKMVSMGVLTKEDRHAVLGNMVGSDLKDGLPAINAKIEELKSKMPSSVSAEDRKKIDDSFKYAITFGKTKEQLGKEMVEQGENLLKESPKVAIRAPIDVIERIFADERFMSQFESGASQGTFNPELRKKVEYEAFGVPEDIEPSKRPIYGYWSGESGEHDKTSLEYYGGVAFILKDSAKERATVTFGDSLDGELVGSKPGSVKLESMEIAEGMISKDNFSYIEAQVHGGVSLNDVEEVVVSDSTMDKMLRNYNAAKDHRGLPGEFAGFKGSELLSSKLKLSVAIRPTYEERKARASAGLPPEIDSVVKMSLMEWIKSTRFAEKWKGSEAGDAFVTHLEKKDGGKKSGSDNRPSWW